MGTGEASAAEGSYRFTVRAVDFNVEHVVTASSLRPPYTWAREAGTWTLRPPPKVYVTDGQPSGGGSQKKKAARRGGKAGGSSASAARGGGGAFHSVGEPSVQASQFTVGTKRSGADGGMWEVDVRGHVQVWVPHVGGGSARSRKRSIE